MKAIVETKECRHSVDVSEWIFSEPQERKRGFVTELSVAS